MRARHAKVHVLMNNAGIQPGSSLFGEPDNWADVLSVNLWGVIHGSRVFAPAMIAHGEPAIIINTGSKPEATQFFALSLHGFCTGASISS